MSAKSIGKTIKTVSTKKKGIQVEFEDGEKLLLSEDVFTEFHLYDGKELSESESRKLKELAGQDVYYAYALKLLSKDMYSCHQVKEKVLAKGAEPELASKIVSRLRKAGLLDDERFARTFASDVGDLRLSHVVWSGHGPWRTYPKDRLSDLASDHRAHQGSHD